MKPDVDLDTVSNHHKEALEAVDTTRQASMSFPLALVRVVLLEMAHLGSSQALTAALVCKNFKKSFLKYTVCGARVHWSRLDAFEQSVYELKQHRADLVPLNQLTIDMRDANDECGEGDSEDGSSKYNSDCREEAVSALNSFNVPVKSVNFLDLFTCFKRSDAIFKKQFVSTIEHLSCKESSKFTPPEVVSGWQTGIAPMFGNSVQSGRPKPCTFPKCKSLFIEVEDHQESYTSRHGKFFAFPVLDFFYVVMNAESYQEGTLESYSRRIQVSEHANVVIALRYSKDSHKPSEKALFRIYKSERNVR
jgi:hypothetical protein